MGIKGLKTFVEDCHILQDFTLNRSELVVDGGALIRSLHEGNTVRYGGEYATFTRQCECFFSNMKSAGIKMCIIFDGGVLGNKSDTMEKKHVNKLNTLAKIARGKEKKTFYLSLFAMECFIGVVRKFEDIVIHTAPYEADPVVARLAEEKGCLALGNDYDLLIFNLTNGFLPLPQLDISTLKQQPLAAHDRVKCKRVFAGDLAGKLQIDIGKLPTFAALRMHVHTNKRDIYEETAKLIQNGDCIEKCLQKIPHPKKKQEMKGKIEETCRSFKLEAPNQDQTNPVEAAVLDLRLPERMKRLIESGGMYHGVIDVWEGREFMPVKQVEDFTRPSSNEISHDIRSIWYGIICAGDRDHPIVKEYSRLRAQRKEYDPQSSTCEVELKHEVTSQDGQTISLSDPETLTELESRRVLMVALEGEDAEHKLKDVALDLQLLLLATRFWLRKVGLRPADDYIKDTIVSVLSGNAASNLPTQQGEIPFLLDVAHAYAQWQSCLVSAHDLNLILGSPLSDFRKDILPNGSDLHRLADALKNGHRLPKCDSQMLIESFLNQ